MTRASLLVVLCRPPDSPDSKTRLVADVGAPQARQVYRSCLRRVIAVAGAVPADLRLAVAGPPLALAELCAGAASDVELVRQYGRTFAERQRNEIRRGLAQGYRRVAFMASDLPHVEPDQIGWTLDGRAEQVRIVPSHDGGYCVLGSAIDLPELVEVPMSRSDTLAELVTALRARGRQAVVADFVVPNINHGSDLRFVTAERGRSAFLLGGSDGRA